MWLYNIHVRMYMCVGVLRVSFFNRQLRRHMCLSLSWSMTELR